MDVPMDTSTWKKSRYTSPDARSAVTLIAELTTPEFFCAHATNSSLKDFPSDNERLGSECSRPIKKLRLLAAYTGPRREEVLAARWSDLSLEKKSVTIPPSLTERLTIKAPKSDKSRTIALPDGLCDVLQAHKATQIEERQLLEVEMRRVRMQERRGPEAPPLVILQHANPSNH
jgi:integrase